MTYGDFTIFDIIIQVRLGSESEDENEPPYITILSLYHTLSPATIFAREILEGCIIISSYRTMITKTFKNEEKKRLALRAVTMSAFWASLVAVIIAAAVCIGLYAASKSFSNYWAEIIEGVSKLVAAYCVLQLSVKVPKWLGIYANSKEQDEDGIGEGLDQRSIKFNVAWNLWREVAECGVFLIPYMLGDSARSIPVSAVIGTAVGVASGFGTHWASNNLNDKFWLAFFLCNLTGWMSVGLFMGGCHEFEEVWGMTPYVWKIPGDFMSHKRFPMVMFKIFGYSSKRTVLMFCSFWIWIVFALGMHYYKYQQSEKIRAERNGNGDKDKKSKSDSEQFDDNMDAEGLEHA